MTQQLPPPDNAGETGEENYTPIFVVGGIVALGLVAIIVYLSYLMVQHPAQTAVIRDIFIIFMGFMMVLIGFVMVILLVQLARLTNLLQHEIKPILENTNDTINTVRGTAIFISESVTEPITKINSYVAGVSRLLDLVVPRQKKPRKK